MHASLAAAPSQTRRQRPPRREPHGGLHQGERATLAPLSAETYGLSATLVVNNNPAHIPARAQRPMQSPTPICRQPQPCGRHCGTTWGSEHVISLAVNNDTPGDGLVDRAGASRQRRTADPKQSLGVQHSSSATHTRLGAGGDPTIEAKACHCRAHSTEPMSRQPTAQLTSCASRHHRSIARSQTRCRPCGQHRWDARGSEHGIGLAVNDDTPGDGPLFGARTRCRRQAADRDWSESSVVATH